MQKCNTYISPRINISVGIGAWDKYEINIIHQVGYRRIGTISIEELKEIYSFVRKFKKISNLSQCSATTQPLKA